MITAGRILIMPKGAYSADETYEMLDLVSHNGISWLAKKTSVGIEPSDANEEYWQNVFSANYAPPTKLLEGRYVDARYSISGNLCFVYLGKATEKMEMNTSYKVGRLPMEIEQVSHASYTMNGRTWVVNAESTSIYVICTDGAPFPDDGMPQLAFVVPLLIP